MEIVMHLIENQNILSDFYHIKVGLMNIGKDKIEANYWFL